MLTLLVEALLAVSMSILLFLKLLSKASSSFTIRMKGIEPICRHVLHVQVIKEQHLQHDFFIDTKCRSVEKRPSFVAR